MDSKTDAGLGGVIAMKSDTVIFSYIGYLKDTIDVSSDLLQHGLDLGLKALPKTLDTVVLSQSYSLDSLGRREENRIFYDNKLNNIFGANTPSNGFGISLSPFTFFSGKERAKRRMRKQLIYNEEQAYVDYRYSGAYIHRITGLSGQNLRIFMLRYRPSYDFIRKANEEDLLRYVNESFKKFQRESVEGGTK